MMTMEFPITVERKVSILIVDDDAANLLALEATLECLGQKIVQANSGLEALRRVLEEDFAVILLDVQMPGMSGIETAALIRERDRSKHTPIIFLTGMVKTAEMMFKGYSAGAVDYLMKPVVSGILRAKVEVFVELAIMRQELQDEIHERARIAVEITKLNMALEQRNEDLLAANEDLETFGHSVSHDLRMPLRHIQGFATMLEDSIATNLVPEDQRRLKLIRESASRMSQLIDDLLKFSRIGRIELRKSPVDMRELVRATIDSLKPEFNDRQVQWKVGSLPGVAGDRNLLGQVWTNLLANSLKYTRPREAAQIEVDSVQHEKELVFFVRDNGVGFNMAYSEKLFGVFQRLHHASEFEGTGVGLANVRKIVQRHGGRTWAEAEEGKGATLYFSLPVP
jgi:two-component system sensor histidine kinase/response regulator